MTRPTIRSLKRAALALTLTLIIPASVVTHVWAQNPAGTGPFDVVHHSNTGDRVLGIHIAPASPPGQFLESWVDMLFVKGFDAGQPIVYLSTDAGQPLTAVLERATYVPALNDASFNGGDDFLGSARERLFGFINGQTGADNPQAQGFVHLIADGHASEDASAANTTLLNVCGDFPTLADPRHAAPTAPCGTRSSACGPPRRCAQDSTHGRSMRTSPSTWRPRGPTC